MQTKLTRAYGGCIGFIGLNGDLNQAITIRTFVSRGNVLYYQAGAGIVAKSNDERELQEVNNKLGALKKAIDLAEKLKNKTMDDFVIESFDEFPSSNECLFSS